MPRLTTQPTEEYTHEQRRIQAIGLGAAAVTRHRDTALEEGGYRSAGGIAHVEKINRSFVNRLLRLTLLAPDRRPWTDGPNPSVVKRGCGKPATMQNRTSGRCLQPVPTTTG